MEAVAVRMGAGWSSGRCRTCSASAHTLEAAGIERDQAEAIAHAIRNGQGDLATKADITTVKANITAVRAEIAAVASRVNTLQWVIGIQSTITLATFAIVAAKLL